MSGVWDRLMRPRRMHFCKCSRLNSVIDRQFDRSISVRRSMVDAWGVESCATPASVILPQEDKSKIANLGKCWVMYRRLTSEMSHPDIFRHRKCLNRDRVSRSPGRESGGGESMSRRDESFIPLTKERSRECRGGHTQVLKAETPAQEQPCMDSSLNWGRRPISHPNCFLAMFVQSSIRVSGWRLAMPARWLAVSLLCDRSIFLHRLGSRLYLAQALQTNEHSTSSMGVR